VSTPVDLAYPDLMELYDRQDPYTREWGTFLMSPVALRAIRRVQCEVGRRDRLQAKHRRRVRTRGHGGRFR
jgi:hypothetical protein